MSRTCILQATLLAALALAVPGAARAQAPSDAAGGSRRGLGIVVGNWVVPRPDIVRAVQPTYRRSLMGEIHFRRELTERVVLETSVGAWRRISERPSALGSTVTTRTYIVPLLTALRVFPITTVRNSIEPYLVGGAGLAVGVQQQSENSPGGGGRSIVTGVGVRAGAGIEIHVYDRFGVLLGGHVQGVRFGEAVDEQEAFAGAGVQGGLSYRFNR
ncbi:MAG TPA: hypothetical protein VF021_05010 [Longimicrobiales bacterium]